MMADELDVEAMLEAPVDCKKDSGFVSVNGDSPKNGIKDAERSKKKHKRDKERKSSSRERKRSKERSREKRHKSKDREKKRHRSKSQEKESKSSRHRRSKSKERRHSKSKDHRRSISRERSSSRDRRYSRRSPPRDRYRYRSPTPVKHELPIEERDQRTVFCMQLAARVRQRDIEEFFLKVGDVREVRLIMDNRTRRHKGIAYVEFIEIESVGKAIALTGTRLCGVPIVVQHSQAEKNRLAAANAAAAANNNSKTPTPNAPANARNGQPGPMSLYVGSLHFNITEDMLRGIFEPFGKVDKIELSRDPETGRSKGYGFIHFRESDDAKKALEQLNGFELAGRPMKVNYVTERSSSDHSHGGGGTFDSDDLDRHGIDLGATGRLQLMAKLAEGTGIELPKAAVNALQLSSSTTAAPSQNGNNPPPLIATQCFLLTNMFDPRTETNPSWPDDIKNDVIEECRKHGGVLHVFVDQFSDEGYVYVKCATIASATATVNALHGRWFAGRMITAAFVPVVQYHNLFLESANATTHL